MPNFVIPTLSADVDAKLVSAQFSLSVSFKQAQKQTSTSRVMMLEAQTLCNLGEARLKTELDKFKVSQVSGPPPTQPRVARHRPPFTWVFMAHECAPF